MKTVELTFCPDCECGYADEFGESHEKSCAEMPPYETVTYVSLPDLLELIEGEAAKHSDLAERARAAGYVAHAIGAEAAIGDGLNNLAATIRKETQS